MACKVAVGRCKRGLTFPWCWKQIARHAFPVCSTVLGGQQREATLSCVAKHQRAISVHPNHGVQKHGAVCVVVSPLGGHGCYRRSCNPSGRSNSHSMPVVAGVTRGPEGGVCAVGRHPLGHVPGCPAVQGLTNPAVGPSETDVFGAKDIQRPHRTRQVDMQQGEVRWLATGPCEGHQEGKKEASHRAGVKDFLQGRGEVSSESGSCASEVKHLECNEFNAHFGLGDGGVVHGCG